MSKQPVTDLSYLREMAMGDDSIIIEIIKVFLKDAPDAIEQMKACYVNKDWEQLAKIAHRIKPNLSYMGMDRARELILDIEQQAKSGNIRDDFRQQITEFDQLCNRAFDELTDKIEQLKA